MIFLKFLNNIQPSWIQAFIAINLGNPGVALLERIKSPSNTSTLFLTPDNLILSAVSSINREFDLVASAILTQGIPSPSVIYS